MKLTKCELLEHLNGDLDMLQLEFDNGQDSALCIWNYASMMGLLNQDVIVHCRQDLYKGNLTKFVETCATVGVVHTLEREEGVKLFVKEHDNLCSISFRDVEEGQTKARAVVYVLSVDFDSNARAEWMNITAQDKERKIQVIKLFNPDTRQMEIRGHYIQCDLRRNKYGFSTNSIEIISSDHNFSPEVEIAQKFIVNSFSGRPDVLDMLATSHFFDYAMQYIDHEPGYLLVRFAYELSLANELRNMTDDVDAEAIRLALLYEKFHVYNQTSPFDKNIVSFAIASSKKIEGTTKALCILNSDDKRLVNERAIIKQIMEMADTLVSIRKGLV